MAFERRVFRLLDVIVILAGLTLVAFACVRSTGRHHQQVAWALLGAFYFLFYRRLAYVMYWSWRTLHLVRQAATLRSSTIQSHCRKENLPIFHILLASYGAEESIEPVLAAIDRLDYPKSHYTTWIVTKRSENERKKEIASLMRRQFTDLRSTRNVDSRLVPIVWKAVSATGGALSSWAELVRSGPLRSLLSLPAAQSLVIEDLINHLLSIQDQPDTDAEQTLVSLGLNACQRKKLARAVSQLGDSTRRIHDDMARILGSPDVFRSQYLRKQLASNLARRPFFRRLGRQIAQRFASKDDALPPMDSAQFEHALNARLVTTQDVVMRFMASSPRSVFRHLDPDNRGYKPDALNIAWNQIQSEGLLAKPRNVFFLIIDSDSILPTHALAAAAKEILAGPEHVIRQMCSLPTANFPACNLFSQFVAVADAVGAVGKWARNTRRQLRPDLHAGSGVLVPAPLMTWIANHAGQPWDSTTLTEDARLIIGQFGLMEGARTTTGFVPAYLLEAVPSEPTLGETYRAYWRQRRRWTSGGFDELLYMARPPSWLAASHYDGSTGEWNLRPGAEGAVAWLRRSKRLLSWAWDHFLWGIGGMAILTHWWAVSIGIAAPGLTFTAIGLCFLLAMPVALLSSSWRSLRWFIPGGLSRRRALVLLIVAFPAIWAYVLPVAVTQAACCARRRSGLSVWEPTRKPSY
jgi:cellulose synthase/poly-beta-1,6-N-acetylglucosamine synthase-like glycosyltransferase